MTAPTYTPAARRADQRVDNSNTQEGRMSMNSFEEHWQHAQVGLPPIHLSRELLHRLGLDTSDGPLDAERASATIARVLARGLDASATPRDTTPPAAAVAAAAAPPPSAFAILHAMALLLNDADTLATVREASAALGTPFGTVALELARAMAERGVR